MRKYKYSIVNLNAAIKFKKRNIDIVTDVGHEEVLLLALIYEESHKTRVGVIVQTNDGIEEYHDKDANNFYTDYIPFNKI